MLAELGMEYGWYWYEFVMLVTVYEAGGADEFMVFFAIDIEYFVVVLLTEGLLVSTVELLRGAVVAVHKIQILGLL